MSNAGSDIFSFSWREKENRHISRLVKMRGNENTLRWMLQDLNVSFLLDIEGKDEIVLISGSRANRQPPRIIT